MDKDLELKLLSDRPIFVGNIPINRITLHDIASIGYSKYIEFSSMLRLSEDGLKEMFGDTNRIELFDAVCALCLHTGFSEHINAFFEVVFGRRPTIDLENQQLHFDDFVITRNQFPEVVRIIRYRNGLIDSNDDEENPADENVRRLLERRRELRKRVAATKQNDADNVRLSDMISTVAVCLHLTLNEVMGYDMYQLKDQLLRYRVFEQYNTHVDAMMHGAGGDTKLKDYLRNISEDY